MRTAAGRSNAKVFFTKDEKFVVKTITRRERKFISEEFLEDYSQRVIGNQSFLVRILAMFRLNPAGTDYLIMENIVPKFKNAVVFDIKGSTVNRDVEGKYDYSDPPYGALLKDVNLRASNYKILVNEQESERIFTDLVNDLELLSAFNLTDYSLLIAFYRPTSSSNNRYSVDGNFQSYSLGIIDYLQKYDFGKASERWVKRIFYRNKQVSVESPSVYKDRLLREIRDLFNLRIFN